ncbi:MAG: type II secretion system F family protein [Kiritimatiellae bacterium]|nr:type II secretion system F family protein [Kiritimatiellia bacterium]
MASFIYTARSRSGEKTEGMVEAGDKRAALMQVESLGLVPVSVQEKSTVNANPTKSGRLTWRGTQGKMRSRETLMFTTELSDLLASGMTLGNALNCLANRNTGNAGDRIIAELRGDIIQGASLSEALAKHPSTFPNLYVSMIRAGEAGGALHEVLKRLVIHYERMQETKEKVVMALVYPMIVLTMGFFTMIFAMIWVIPKFQVVFDQMNQTLPLSTRILIGTSQWLIRYGWIAGLMLAISGIMANRAVKTKQGQLWWHGFLLRLPLLKGVIAAGIYATFARTLGSLLGNGVPVLQALGIVEKTVGNAVIAREIRNARDRVTDGTTISGPLAAGKMLPQMMTDMLSVGEQTGDVSGALTHIARRYENELDRNLKIFTTALEPMLIVFVAIMVGFVAISILMAVFNLTSGLGG